MAASGKRGGSETGRAPGTRFRDCDACPEVVVLPPGSFLMGSPDTEEGRQGNDDRPVRLSNMLGYGCGDLFAGLTGTTIGIWIFFFYTTVVGLDPIEAGSILGIARVRDAVTDPAMGYITDNTARIVARCSYKASFPCVFRVFKSLY